MQSRKLGSNPYLLPAGVIGCVASDIGVHSHAGMGDDGRMNLVFSSCGNTGKGPRLLTQGALRAQIFNFMLLLDWMTICSLY